MAGPGSSLCPASVKQAPSLPPSPLQFLTPPSQALCCRIAHSGTTGSPTPSPSHICAPCLAPLGTCGPSSWPLQRCPQYPQVLREGLEHLPETLARGRSLKADGRTLHYPLVHFLRDPTVCQLRDRTVCWGHSWAVEAAPGRDDPRSGLRSRAGRILPVALGSALRRATPPCGHCPGGSSCCSGNCLHPSPGSGYSPPPPASRARPGKPCLSLREYFPRAQN